MAKKITEPSNVTDISLSVTNKKKFRIDGDDSRIIELNTSDMTILSRLKTAYPKLIQLSEEATKNWPDNLEDVNADNFLESESVDNVISILESIDKQMRELIDYIFDSAIANICAPFGSMYDIINGKFRFEHIISTLSNLYESNIDKEVKQMSNRVRKHTDKYIK